MIETILGIFGIILILLLVRPVTTFFHELGHAIPSLLFTNKEVGMYVGSYGDTDKSFVFEIGRLKILFRYKITEWNIGFCTHHGNPSFIQTMLIILGGPFFSLLMGLFCYYLIKEYQGNTFITLVIATVLVSGFWDFMVNLIPQSEPIVMNNGSLVLNDGSQFLYLLKTSKFPPSFSEGLHLLEKNQKEEGIEKLKLAIDSGCNDIMLHRLIMDSLKGEPEKAIAFNDTYFKQFKFQSPDYKNLGDVYTKVNEPSFAIQCYTKAIELNYKNQEALLERAKRYIHVGLEGKALEDLKVVNLIEENEEARKLEAEINRSSS